MKNSIVIKYLLASFCISIIVSHPTFANRSIHLSGIVMDATSLTPINAAKIFDDNNQYLGITNENGFFDLTVSTLDKGEIHFGLKIKKDGYNTFNQKEHWGDLSENMNATYYFGLKNKLIRDEKSFGELSMTEKSQNYTEVLETFGSIRDKLNFEKKIKLAKENNEKILFEISDKFYVISNTGWIEIKSTDEEIIIDGKKNISAKKLNTEIKRSSITHMTTISNKNASIAVFTK